MYRAAFAVTRLNRVARKSCSEVTTSMPLGGESHVHFFDLSTGSFFGKPSRPAVPFASAALSPFSLSLIFGLQTSFHHLAKRRPISFLRLCISLICFKSS